MVRILHVDEQGRFEEVYSSKFPLMPSPWPLYRSKAEWRELIDETEKEIEAPL
jgi:hypothetical protein